MPSDLPSQVGETIQNLRSDVEKNVEDWQKSGSPAAFRAMEIDIHALFRRYADELSSKILNAIAQDPALQAKAVAAAQTASAGLLRNAEARTVEVTLLGGSKTKVKTPYLPPQRRKSKRGKKRGVSRRRRVQKGLYPVLAALGIWFGVTPALAGEISRQVADSDSVRTGREALARRGIDLGHKQTLRIVDKFGARVAEQRTQWLLNAMERPAIRGPLSGKRVVVATDGGRIRERVVCPGRRNEKTGHHRYDAPWCEPKLLTIYVVDDNGEVERSFRPILDGTLGDCDVVFTMLAAYLKALGAHDAKQLIVLGDGAKWIWERTERLAELVGLPKERMQEIVDWYHAVETLHTVIDARPSLPEARRESWLKRAKNALYAGDIAKLMKLFDEIAFGRHANAVDKHRDYFERNAKRMQYKSFVASSTPVGSGAIESGVRRVINMRMKANGTFWLYENAESMLLLRGYLKAGRFDDLVDWSITTAAPWWQVDSQRFESPILERAGGES